MEKIKSLEDLKKLRAEALEKRTAKVISGQKEVIVGMGTVGIAAGARETLKAILDYIDHNNLANVIIRQTGNIGIDSYEPVVQVITPGAEKVTYGRVNTEMVKVIMDEHVVNNRIVADYKIEG